MKLTSVLLSGFKSFGTQTTLEFNQRYQGIVGPNGCGKSVIFESIRWALLDPKLDEPVPRTLFRGTDSRRRAKSALVTLTFEMGKDRQLVLSRFLDRTGKFSDYRVNEESVSLDQVPPEVNEVASLLHVIETPEQLFALAEIDARDLLLLVDDVELLLEEEHQIRPYRKALQKLAWNENQIILCTREKLLMNDVDAIIGVTMEEWGASKAFATQFTQRLRK